MRRSQLRIGCGWCCGASSGRSLTLQRRVGCSRQCLSKDLHRYNDRLSVLTVDVDDTPENWEWIRHFTSHLLQRFEQLEIYVTSYLIVVV
jgi:hypothetical protein